MNRREMLVVLLALGAAATPAHVNAQRQPPAKPYRIGLLPDFDEQSRKSTADAMRDLGWKENVDFAFVLVGSPQKPDEIEPAARRMVGERPDLILVRGTVHATAVHRLTKQIPVVMMLSGYPVEAGLANSLARPGKNVTGNTVYAGAGIWGKFIELLREVRPGLQRIGVFFAYVPPGHSPQEVEPGKQEMMRAARALGLAVHIEEVASPDRLPAAMEAIDAQRPEALLVTSGQGLWAARHTVMQFAVRRRLPTIVDFWWPGVEPQPLLVHAPPPLDLVRSAASYADRILKGAKPGDLPIQQPSRFDLVVNLKTAKAIGLDVPQPVLLRATRVIE